MPARDDLPTRQEVIAFLRAAGHTLDPSPEQVERIAPLVAAVGAPDLPRWNFAIKFVGTELDAVPSLEAFRKANAIRWRRARRRAAAMRCPDLSPSVIAAARAFVDTVWLETDRGPTWRQVGRHLGWTCRETTRAIQTLLELGELHTDGAYRSLRTVRPRTDCAPGAACAD